MPAASMNPPRVSFTAVLLNERLSRCPARKGLGTVRSSAAGAAGVCACLCSLKGVDLLLKGVDLGPAETRRSP